MSVKIYCARSAGSEAVRQLVSDANVMVTSVVAYAETRTAFARLRRVGTNGTVHNDEQIAGADRVFAFEVK